MENSSQSRCVNLCAVNVSPERLDDLVASSGLDIKLIQVDDCQALPAERLAALDVVLAEVRNPDFNPNTLLQNVRVLAPQAQLAFLGEAAMLVQVRQKLLLMGVLSDQWSFLRIGLNADWAAVLLEARDKSRRRRALKQASASHRTWSPAGVQPAVFRREHDLHFLISAVEHAHEAILFLDPQGLTTRVNPAAQALYGLPQPEFLGRDIRHRISEAGQVRFEHLFRQVVHAGRSSLVELEHLDVRNAPIPVEQALAPVTDWRGLVIGVTMTVRDIRERLEKNRLEQAHLLQELETERMQALNLELEHRVQVRTAELLAANRELEAFSYSVSHDLRAPLRAIDGFSLALLEDYGDRLDAQGCAFLERVRRASQDMARLIDALLTLSRLSRRELQCSVTDLSALAQAAVALLAQAEPGRAVRVYIEDGLRVEADPALMEIVLQNLLSNAWKFTRNTPDAEIRFGARIHKGGPVFFVRDNGAGFDMAYADKLFSAFQRLHGPGEFEGNGIGLATVHRIIERHGGRIWAESEVGAGASFYFMLHAAEKEFDEKT